MDKGEIINNVADEKETLEQKYFFSPENGNVAFSSAIDGWAFTLKSVAPGISKKLGMNPKGLIQFLWGEYYYSSKTKQMLKKPPTDDSKVNFVQYVLAPLVQVYKKFFPEEIFGNTNEK